MGAVQRKLNPTYASMMRAVREVIAGGGVLAGRRSLLVVLLLAVVVALSGCQTDGAESTTSTEAAVEIKPAMAGLVDRHNLPDESVREVVNGFVVLVNWSELQPEPFGPIADDNPLDLAISEVRSIEAANPGTNLQIKLRILGGLGAPEDLKELSGGPVAVMDPRDNVSGTIGRFWTDGYADAYVDLHAKLAGRYDDTPELRVVSISQCMTVYAEPFIRDVADDASVANLLAAEFDSDQDRDCIRRQVDAHQVWRSTRSGLAFNPYQVINQDGTVGVDLGFTVSMMDYCREVLGERCVLENNSVRWPPFEGRYERMYESMSELGSPISLQTAKPELVGDLAATVEWAIGQGAGSVELPRTYDRLLTPEELETLDAALEANAFGS